MTDKRKVSYKPVSYTINTTKLESDYSETKTTNNLIGVSFKTKNEIKKQINGILEVLKKYKNKKLTDEIKKELDDKLKEFNNYIRNISLNTSNFGKIQDLINVFRADYYNVVGIKRDEKEDITAENGIGLFELFEVEKKVEETNEQTMKSSSSTGTETGSSTSSDDCEMKEIKETKIEDDTTLTTSDSSENEMKKVESSIESKQILEWSEIGINKKYVGEDTNITHAEAQKQVYQIAYSFANKIKEGTFKVEENTGKTFAISDTHGDMGALLEALLRSGVVEFVDTNNPCKVIVDPNNQDNKILIPNLKINKDCNNKLIILGDIIDRGQHSDSCMMLMKDVLKQQKDSGKSKNIILTVGNHEDMTIIGANDYLYTLDNKKYTEGNNKDYNTAQGVLMSMVEEDEMVFCYYDESSNTIYSHVPFDVDNTYNALNFVYTKIQTEGSFLECDNDEIANLAIKIDNQDENLSNEETKLLTDILNKLYKYACKNKDVMTELQQNVYCKDGQNDGLLWNRGYTKEKRVVEYYNQSTGNTETKLLPPIIKGPNFVGGHDPNRQQTIQQNTDKTIINIDTIRSCRYTNTTKTALVEIKPMEGSKIKADKLDDVNTIRYNNKTIKTINGNKPSKLSDDVKFEVEDINKYTNKSQKLETIISELTSSKYTSCIEYLKQENYSEQSLKDIILDDRFKENCLLICLLTKDNNEIKINDTFLKYYFITPILNEYKKYHKYQQDVIGFINTIFNVLTSDKLKLTGEQKNELEKIKEEYLAENAIKKESEKTSQTNSLTINVLTSDELKLADKQKNELETIKTDYLAENAIKKESEKTSQTTTSIVSGPITLRAQQGDDTLIGEMQLRNAIKKLSYVVNTIIDKQLIDKDDKQKLIQNTIDLIKKQKEQLKNDNKKLQKAATLMLLLEVYKINIDKFNSVNEVYKMLNDTIKKEVKKINDLKTTNVNLDNTISAINSVLSNKGKEEISGVSISF